MKIIKCRYSLPNGEMFIGPNIKNFTEKGKGSYYYFDGSIYKGDLLKRKRNGMSMISCFFCLKMASQYSMMAVKQYIMFRLTAVRIC